MGAPASGLKASEQPAAETLLSALKTISAAERRKHASVLNYWLTIRGDKEFPPLHDLDPLELSDAGGNSALFELLSGGHDAEIRHLGEALRDGDDWPEQIMDAANPSVLACIARKLPLVAISRDFLAFEDSFTVADGTTKCWVTLLPLSAGGAWVDYVYALVSFETTTAKGEKVAPKARRTEVEPQPEPQPEPVVEDDAIDQPAEAIEAVADDPADDGAEPNEQDAAPAKPVPGFTKLFDSLAGLTGFYGSHPVKVEPVLPELKPVADELPPVDEPQPDEAAEAEELVLDKEPATIEPAAEQPAPRQPPQAAHASEGTLQNKLTDVRSKADEARLAKLRANAALYEGLGAAYDFALDAEDAPEEYLRLVEAQGLKIQLRSPMKPVVRLAFDGLCDEATIKQLEAVLAWAFEQELPRGALAEQIEAAGGIGPILNGVAKAA